MQFTEEEWEKIKAVMEKEISLIVADGKEPKTTITVWYDKAPTFRDVPYGKLIWDDRTTPPYKGFYSFKGLPDIDRVIKETLEKGALAVKVKCSEEFFFEIENTEQCYIWYNKLGLTINGVEFMLSTHHNSVSDTDIEAAITEWMKRRKPPERKFHVGQIVIVDEETAIINMVDLMDADAVITNKKGIKFWKSSDCIRPATSDEIASFYTRNLAGEPVRVYEDADCKIRLYWVGLNTFDSLLPWTPHQARALCEAAHIPIMPYSESNGVYTPPGGEVK